ncbi:MAG: D-cysteine desulfhydrase [Anaerolineae bacterium]
MSASALTGQLPRVALAFLPTPVHALPRLENVLGDSPRLLIKRDDQTGLATGGNKTRKLEFLVGDALAQGADTLITPGGPQSNHCRQTAAAAARYGLRCVLVLSGPPQPPAAFTGNLLLNALLGAEIRWTEGRPREEVMAEVAREVTRAGGKPYVIPTGGSVPVGAAGYVAAVEELAEQLRTQGEQVDRIVVVAGSGGTHAGVLVGVKALGLGAQMIGMNNFAVPDIAGTVLQLARESSALLGLNLAITPDDLIFYDACGTHPYGVITDAEREGIRLLARTEGILLDPVYTGRAFAHLIGLIRMGAFAPEETILFWHTGGFPGLLARAEDMV